MPDALRADCARCFGLCCVVLSFSTSADFAIDKDAGEPCPNLRADFRCSIHDRLRERGFAGCTVYDCFGAGQQVSQVTFAGRDWRRTPETAQQMFTVFRVVRQLHELRWYLREALALAPDDPPHGEIEQLLRESERLAGLDPDALAALDVSPHRERAVAVLSRVSEQGRAGLPRGQTRPAGRNPSGADLSGADLSGADLSGADLSGADLHGADLMGRNLSGADLRGANLRGAFLIGANLRGADLRLADLIGADLRRADLGAADLTGSLFVAQSQIDAANGDARTELPASLVRPVHWS